MNPGILLALALLATQDAPGAARASAPVPAPAVGSAAPDFVFQSFDGNWRNLHDVLVAGDVLLVFGASDDQLRSLQRDHDALLARGIVPVGVLPLRDSAVWNVVRRDHVEYSVLSDPNATIARQFGVTAGGAGGARWFVIDHKGVVRGSGAGATVPADWNAIASSALGREDVRTTSAH